MFRYVFRRIILAFPVLLGVNIITFILFFTVNTPDDMARAHLGDKNLTKETIQRWKKYHGYDLPLFFNTQENDHGYITNTLFFSKIY
ncbi:MAG: ABC transporter permease, partial [Legionellales bacterium]|nr:ABC transporter permease [Legionellales bacterium]